jgi:hypothetical protein
MVLIIAVLDSISAAKLTIILALCLEASYDAW